MQRADTFRGLLNERFDRWTRLAKAPALLGAALALAVPTAATAAYGPGAEPVSARGSDLGDQRSWRPLVSGDGRWVVFRTQSPALLGPAPDPAEYYSDGWVRKNLETGAIDFVATPERRLRSDRSVVAEGVARDVAGISDDGRYVLLGSTVALCCGVTSSITPEVYVRDMTRPRSDPSGYELVSAEDGGTGPAGYDDRRAGSAPGIPGYALSDDGRKALFVTATASTLPRAEGTTTPPGQVFVRDLDARTTRLVTRDLADPALPGTPVPHDGRGLPQAALSGDGGAIAWTATNADRQARFLPGEPKREGATQLLWRDLRAAPSAPARRVAGEADPGDPGCPPDAQFVPSPTALGPCYGPFSGPDDLPPTTLSAAPPRVHGISDDGRRVLFGSQATRRPFLGVARAAGYVADMSLGPRKHAVAVAWWDDSPRAALAGDGRHAVLVSSALTFDELLPVGKLPGGDSVSPNLFSVDLEQRTVERMTTSPTGADFALASNSLPVEAPSLSDDGAVAAFSAGDGNLFVGDVNEVEDVLLIRRRIEDRQGTQHELPPAPAPPHVVEPPLTPLRPSHAIFGRVLVGPRGVATVRVRVPGAGILTAAASGRVRARRRGRAAARVAVGTTTRRPRAAAMVTLRVAPSARARRALKRAPHRIDVRLTIRFASAAGRSRSDQRYTLTGVKPRRGGSRR